MDVEVIVNGGHVNVVTKETHIEVADQPKTEIEVKTGFIIGNPYEGTYVITPTASGYSLPTKSKTMKDDLTVNAIPYHETSNESGGITCSIAS